MTHDEMEQVLDEAFSKVVGEVRGIAFPPNAPNDYKKWTKEEDFLLMLLRNKYNLTTREQAKLFGRTEIAIINRANKLEDEQNS